MWRHSWTTSFTTFEVLFGVANHFGQDTESAMAEIVDILENGMFKHGIAESVRRRSSL